MSEQPFIKSREAAIPGSIPDVLQMFVAEVRFYREIAPVVGVRVPACIGSEEDGGATRLVLENLSDWEPGADPPEAARVLAGLHGRWQGVAGERWTWLRSGDAAVDLVGALFDQQWPAVARRPECSPAVRDLGERLCGRIPEVEQLASQTGPPTLVHGDASLLNMRTGPAGEIALLDWEDVGSGPGVTDLAWLLVSSVDPARWDETISGYGSSDGLEGALPAAASQAILSLSYVPADAGEAIGWIMRIEEAARRVNEG